ncbi:hypothetical protein EYF80_027051 [Liparis tanakae]|uniref:Uncharacterized protein n=1 Tax=Liparis tanakae TaxID=230148 RepID=A0A4Z2HA66_9TELE|nr:hypothetical protein EYF80_027051 [Liparis tanakae]
MVLSERPRRAAAAWLTSPEGRCEDRTTYRWSREDTTSNIPFPAPHKQCRQPSLCCQGLGTTPWCGYACCSEF